MPQIRPRSHGGAALCLLLIGAASGQSALADEPARIELNLKDHRFTPSEIHLPSGKAAILAVRNDDATPEEFESSALKVEKVIVAGGSAMIRLRPLDPGRYPFSGEFHPDSAQGVVVAE